MTPLELDDIARELREARPTMDRDFAAKLDAWAAEGFPRDEQAPRGERVPSADGPPEPPHPAPRRWPPQPARRRWLLPAFGAAATAVLVIGVAVSQVGDGGLGGSVDQAGDAVSPSGGSESELAAPPGSPQASGDAAAPATSAEVSGDTGAVRLQGKQRVLLPGRPRVQETAASLTLSTEPGEVADVADGVVAITDRYRGFVVSSNVSTGEANPRASFDLRIPSQNLQAALTELSDLAHVKSRNEGTIDITEPFVTAGERFKDAKAEVDALLEQLAEAGDATEIESIRAQLRIARAELAAARAQLKALKQRAGLSVVSVGVVSEGDGPGWSLDEAVEDAIDVLEAIGGGILVALAVLVPLGAVGAAAWFGTAGIRRRRRESILDG
jgi:hypothetical protein